MNQRTSISTMENSYTRFKRQPKTLGTKRAEASAGPGMHHDLKNNAAPATSQGSPFNRFAPKAITIPRKRIVIMKSAKKGPAK